MDYAEEAYVAKLNGDNETFLRLSRKALELEKQAVQLVEAIPIEPTRSILYRSAASLALDCGGYREAEKLITTALAGNPSEDIIVQLKDLLEQVQLKSR